MTCPTDFQNVEPLIDRVLTQYRESPKLLHLIRTYLRQAEIVQQAICDLPAFFDIDTAVGHQLTLLGLRMGWPRAHCICEVQPMFGFDCGNNSIFEPVAGFCTNSTWADCTDRGTSYVSIDDDDLYRRFLKARRFQIIRKFDRASLDAAIKVLWGDNARILASSNGEVVLAPGRVLTELETTFLQLYPRVLPLAIGIRARFHFGSYQIFGFGSGWLGFCEGSGGAGVPLVTEETSENILTETGQEILANSTTDNPEWLCRTDVHPYDC